MIAITQGKNTFTEIKCNSILPLEDIEKVITCKHCLVEVKDVYVKLLYHCHVDTENESREIFTTQSSLVWAIFETFLVDIKAIVTANTSSSGHRDSISFGSGKQRLLRAYVADDVVKVLIGYFGHNLFNHIQTPHVKFNIISLSYAYINNNVIFSLKKLKSSIFKALYSKLSQLSQCAWLNESQKSNLSLLLNIMQEKSSLMRCAELPSTMSSNKYMLVTRSLQLPSMNSYNHFQSLSNFVEQQPLANTNRRLSFASTSNMASLGLAHQHFLNNFNHNNNKNSVDKKKPQVASTKRKFDATPILPPDALVKLSTDSAATRTEQTQSSRIVNEIYQVLIILTLL